MLIKDEAAQTQDSFYKSVETDNERIISALGQYRDVVLIGKDDDPTNILHRMGKSLPATDLIKKLEGLSYYIKIERNPKNPKMFVVYNMRANGKAYVAAFEDGIVPERTLMNTKTVQDVDPATLRPDWKPGKYDAPIKDINGIIQIDESQPRPGLISYTIPWHIEKMGYRTILLRLIEAGVASQTKVELAFGSDDTPEWAAKTGNRDKSLARF